MAFEILLEPSELRDIIIGKTQYRRCPDCEGRGECWYVEYTLKERPHDSDFKDLSPEQAANFCLDDWPDWDWAEVLTDECETCNTVGYVCAVSG
jgi:hypothetical protein